MWRSRRIKPLEIKKVETLGDGFCGYGCGMIGGYGAGGDGYGGNFDSSPVGGAYGNGGAYRSGRGA